MRTARAVTRAMAWRLQKDNWNIENYNFLGLCIP